MCLGWSPGKQEYLRVGRSHPVSGVEVSVGKEEGGGRYSPSLCPPARSTRVGETLRRLRKVETEQRTGSSLRLKPSV